MAIITDFIAGRSPPDLYDAYLTPLFETWMDVLVELTPPSGTVIDIACGTGIVSRKLAASAGVDHVDAIDVAPPMIAKAQSLTPSDAAIRFHVASADALPFDDNQFSSAFCQQGLQFFPNKVDAVREAARVTAPGGKLTFAIWTAADDGNPAFGALEQIIAEELGDDLIPFGPFSYGDAAQIEHVAREAGLDRISVKRFERQAPLPDPRTLVLFDLLFLGRPGPDGALQPLFDPNDAAMDAVIETLIAKYERSVSGFLQADGTLLAPSAAHILVGEVAG